MKRIILTGGGTAGHVTPNIALIPHLREAGFDIHYVGSYEGIEKRLIEELHIPYHGISTGKLRRYLSKENITDSFRVIKGCGEADSLVKSLKPDVIFSKGGYVSVPVVLAAKKHRVPAIIHESDITPGLANKISIPCARAICCNFPETLEYLPKNRSVLTGTPIREELFSGNPLEGYAFTGLQPGKPVLLILGGSQGSQRINELTRSCLDELLSHYQIIHQCGKNNLDPSLDHKSGYVQYDYVKEELRHLLAMADMVISRAGANAICELQALNIPNLLLPLGRGGRGDQILNAKSFKKQGFSEIILDENLTKETFLAGIQQVYDNRKQYKANMERMSMDDAIPKIMNIIQRVAK